MKRLNSLKGRNTFKEVYKKGKRLQSKNITIYFFKIDNNKENSREILKNINTYSTKIGIAVNKKIGNAVNRNRLKRKIRSICSEFINEMRTGYYIIIKPGIKTKDFSYNKLKSDIFWLLKNTGVIKK